MTPTVAYSGRGGYGMGPGECLILPSETLAMCGGDHLGLCLSSPDRRNPQLATAEGSEGRTPELTALMVKSFYSPLLPKSIPVTGNNQIITSRNTLRLSSNSTERHHVRVNACQGSKLLLADRVVTKYVREIAALVKPLHPRHWMGNIRKLNYHRPRMGYLKVGKG